MKRAIAALLLLTAAVSAAPPSMAAGGVPSDWATTDVARAVSVGLVPEALQGNYTDNITRAEFIKIDVMFLAAQYNVDVDDFLYLYSRTHWDQDGNHPEYRENVFTDTNDYYVNLACAIGLAAGRGDGTFGPGDPITRQEAAVLLIKSYFVYSGGIKHGPKSLEFEQMEDIGSVADWARSDACYMYEWGVLTGVDQNRFGPLGYLTREQCFVAFLRFCERAPVAKYPTGPGSLCPLHYLELVEDIINLENYQLISQFDTPVCSVLYGTQADTPNGPRPSLWIVWKDGGRKEVTKNLPQDTPDGNDIILSDLRVIDDTTFRFTRYVGDNSVYYELGLVLATLTLLSHPDN